MSTKSIVKDHLKRNVQFYPEKFHISHQKSMLMNIYLENNTFRHHNSIGFREVFLTKKIPMALENIPQP